jgi:hypothetical protein
MANQASLSVSVSWGWQDYVTTALSGYSPSPPTPQTETGTAVGTLISGEYASGAIPDGGTISGDWSISANVQHIDMAAIASGYGNTDIGLKGKGEIGQAYIFVSADFVDYITNTSDGTLTLQMTYTLHGSTPIGDLQYTGLGSELEGGPFYFGTGSGSASTTFTIPAHTTIPYALNYDFGGNSGWSWGIIDQDGTYEPAPNPTGYEFSYDASSTGHTYIDELDSKGKPVPGNPDLVFASGIDWSSPACFAAGTRILTRHGEVAVEALRVGDHVVTLRGRRLAPVAWLGYRHVNCVGHPRPHEVWPIRIKAGAIADGIPHRDLWLSAEHAVLLRTEAETVLVPVRHLLNGTTIAQVPYASVTYWHVELASHEVIVAEGLPAETYLDTGNRADFANSGPAVTVHPTFADAVWRASACAPQLRHGDALDALQRRLAGRAADRPLTTRSQPSA